MKKCELVLEPYEAPKMDVLSMEVEHGFAGSLNAGNGDLDWSEDSGIEDGNDEGEM